MTRKQIHIYLSNAPYLATEIDGIELHIHAGVPPETVVQPVIRTMDVPTAPKWVDLSAAILPKDKKGSPPDWEDLPPFKPQPRGNE